jgi:hypothetical protein
VFLSSTQYPECDNLTVSLDILRLTLPPPSYGIVRLAKWKIVVQMSVSLLLFFLNRTVNPYGKFSEPGFPHNCAKKDRHDLNMGCTDASRRQLQSVLKIGV